MAAARATIERQAFKYRIVRKMFQDRIEMVNQFRNWNGKELFPEIILDFDELEDFDEDLHPKSQKKD